VNATGDRDRPVALITGGARRVGAAVCLALARAGCDVLLTFRQSEQQARDLVSRVRDEIGVAANVRPLDLSDLDRVERFARDLAEELPRLDVLVHNASRYGASPLAELSTHDLLEYFHVNAAAPALLTRALADRLRASPLPGGGAVVAMCDIHAMGRPRRNHLAYSMSKAALVELVRSLARDLAPEVRVNGAAPGVVAFPEHGYEADPEYQRRYLSRVPLGRAGSPEDAAEAVRWLALDATYVTGHILRVDGGRWLA